MQSHLVPRRGGDAPVIDLDLDEDDFDLNDESDAPDPLDAPNFNATDYINKQFPNEVSLVGLDDFVAGLKAQQRQIDDGIRHAIRRQAAMGRRAKTDLEEAKSAVVELFERIKAIKSKAEQSEALVSDVCRDIKSLDIAKRNLTLVVTSLKRLVMLVQALDQLRALASCRKYHEASSLIHAIENLAAHFQDLCHVPRVADLLERKAAILGDLRNQLLEDYTTLHGAPAARPDGIESAAYCVDAMGLSVRREVITQFCLRLLEDYKAIFQPPREESKLESAERRYAWIKRTVREYEEKFASHFPESWRVPCYLCEHFCHVTRQHLVEVLGTCHHNVDPELMVRVLRKSIDFENDLVRKYPADGAAPAPAPTGSLALPPGPGFKYPDVLATSSSALEGSLSEEARDEAPRFRGIISACFEAYLASWVHHEEKQLLEALELTTSAGADKVVSQGDDVEDDDDPGLEPRCLYSSAPELFASMKGSMTKCVGFSTHQTLFDVFQVFRKVIAHYSEILKGQLPIKATTAQSKDGIKAVCCVIGTAEYCDETLPMLAESMLKVIDPAFESRVSFAAEQDLVSGVVSTAMQVLVQSVNASLDESFKKMIATNWAQFSQLVSDQSAYVGEFSDRLHLSFDPIATHLSKLHFRFFCDRFVQAFCARFIAEIYRCKKISEQGAQQLLLDTSSIKTTLLEVPVIAAKGRQMPTAYSNYVLREMGRAEAMLKVLSSPGDVDAAAVSALLSDDRGSLGSDAEVDRILALRAGTITSGGVLDGSPTLSPRDEDPGAGLTAVRNKMVSLGDQISLQHMKTSEDLKKLSGDVKKKLLGGMSLPGMGRKSTSSAM